MFKRLLVLMMVFLLVLVPVGCSSNKTDDSKNTSKNTQQETSDENSQNDQDNKGSGTEDTDKSTSGNDSSTSESTNDTNNANNSGDTGNTSSDEDLSKLDNTQLVERAESIRSELAPLINSDMSSDEKVAEADRYYAEIQRYCDVLQDRNVQSSADLNIWQAFSGLQSMANYLKEYAQSNSEEVRTEFNDKDADVQRFIQLSQEQS